MVRLLFRLPTLRTGGIDLGGAGNGMLLMSHHGLDQLHGAAEAQIAGVQAEVIAVHSAPLLGRVRTVYPLRLRAAVSSSLQITELYHTCTT